MPVSPDPRLSRRYRALAFIGASGLTLGLAATSAPATAAPAAPSTTYIVQLADLPVASYTGGVPGYAATKPAAGKKLDKGAAQVKQYRSYLTGRHDATLRHATSGKKLYDYTLTFNGFAAKMTSLDAQRLSATPGVLSVTKDEIRKVDTTNTPEFLGLTKKGGLWDQLGGTGARGAGDGVVVGVLDTGLWPESASFAPLQKPTPVSGWNGVCQTGEQWTASTCNNKVIGARYYTEGFGGADSILQQFPGEFISARDADGHGSHTSSTAAGNFGVDAVVDGVSLGKESGMAPNARVAIYKVCWGQGTAGGCRTVDTMQAIEDATADGVDVINYSISGSRVSMVDPVELQMLFAADAGVFVSMSAGNDGPAVSTVAHNDPWVISVAAGTHNRVFNAAVTLGNGQSFTGAGLGAAVPSAPLALASSVGKDGANPSQVQLCFSGTLDPAKAAGKIVICDRGTNDRVDKSLAVKLAGGVGMVMTNISPNSLNADFHSVPTVHVNETSGAAIKAYVSGTTGPTAALSQGEQEVGAEAPFVAAFSSRGPALASSDLLKPDVMAPGVDVLASVSPAGHNGRNFDFISGTSMASPHIAGLGALIRQLHPDWSPMAIKSALMTTAAVTNNKGAAIQQDTGGAATPFDYGSGQVTPNSAADPGLVYDSGFVDWVRFLCGAGQLAIGSSTCAQTGSIDPSDLNTPNIAIGQLTGTQTVTRTVTNVSKSAGVYTPTVQAPSGVSVSVSPRQLVVPPRKSAKYTVTFTRTSADFNQYAFGSLTWSDGRHKVASQLAVRPVGLAAPAAVSGSGTSGSTSVKVVSGFEGQLSASAAGLVAATPTTEQLKAPTSSGFDTANPAAGPSTQKVTVTVPAGTRLARFSTFDRDYATGTDLDMFVYRGGTSTLVGSSGGSTAEEQVDLANPAAGTYDIYVDAFALAPGLATQDVTTFSWTLGSSAAGNVTITPESQTVTSGGPADVTLNWSGLAAGQRWLGAVSFSDGSTTAGSTIVRVDS